jgi:hypothetical protein
MHAESPDEDAPMGLDHIKRICGQFAVHLSMALGKGNERITAHELCRQILGSDGLVEGKIVDDLAGRRARPAADAECCIYQDGFAHFLNISDEKPVGRIVGQKTPTR